MKLPRSCPPPDDHLTALLFEEVKDIAIFLMDNDRRITSWCPGVERMLGYSEEQFIGLDGRVLFTPEDRARKADDTEYEAARRNGRVSDMRWHRKKDGSRIFVEGVLRVISDRKGKPVGYGKVMRDISPNRIEDSMLQAILNRTPDAIT